MIIISWAHNWIPPSVQRQLRQHLEHFIKAYNFARRVKTLKGLYPDEFIVKVWTKEPGRFKLDPTCIVHLSDSPWRTAFERFAMPTQVPRRSDFDTIGLRMLARRSRDPDRTRRHLALAEIYDGGSRSDAARTGGVGVQIVRDWVVRFNAKGFDGLVNGKAPGARSILDDNQRQALRRIVEGWPHPGCP